MPPRIPKLIDLGPDTKEAVIGGIKVVLKRLKQQSRIPESAEYASLLGNPDLMARFIAAVKADRTIANDVAVDATGRPVADDEADTLCGVTLAQVERLLVFTCAKRLYGETARNPTGKLPDELRPHIAFDWQLPLLRLYRRRLQPDHVRALGASLLVLRTPAAVECLADQKPFDVVKAKRATGARFDAMLTANPAAIRGLAVCDSAKFAIFDSLLGERVWEFFAGDLQMVVEMVGTSNSRLAAYGRNIADMNLKTFRVLEGLPTGILAPFMDSFHEVLGDRGKDLLGNDEFAIQFLRDIVDAFRELGQGAADLGEVGEVAALKWSALRTKLLAWLDGRQLDERMERRRQAAEDAQNAVDKMGR